MKKLFEYGFFVIVLLLSNAMYAAAEQDKLNADLDVACMRRDLAEMERLLKAGAADDREGRSHLERVMDMEFNDPASLTVMKLLMPHYSDMSAARHGGTNPVMYALCSELPFEQTKDRIELLLTTKMCIVDESVICAAVKRLQIAVIELEHVEGEFKKTAQEEYQNWLWLIKCIESEAANGKGFTQQLLAFCAKGTWFDDSETAMLERGLLQKPAEKKE